jgi:hypothetical protein
MFRPLYHLSLSLSVFHSTSCLVYQYIYSPMPPYLVYQYIYSPLYPCSSIPTVRYPPVQFSSPTAITMLQHCYCTLPFLPITKQRIYTTPDVFPLMTRINSLCVQTSDCRFVLLRLKLCNESHVQVKLHVCTCSREPVHVMPLALPRFWPANPHHLPSTQRPGADPALSV